MKTIKEFSVSDLGVEYPDYFWGFGVSFTRFTDCAVGIGHTPAEAFEDALELLAQVGWDVESISKPDDIGDKSEIADDDEEAYHYVGVRVK